MLNFSIFRYQRGQFLAVEIGDKKIFRAVVDRLQLIGKSEQAAGALLKLGKKRKRRCRYRFIVSGFLRQIGKLDLFRKDHFHQYQFILRKKSVQMFVISWVGEVNCADQVDSC